MMKSKQLAAAEARVLSFIYIDIYWNKLQYGCHPRATFYFPQTLPGEC
jgi:hypothetical protein